MFYLIPINQPKYDLSSVEGWAMDSDLATEAVSSGLVQLENGNFEDRDGQEWKIVER